VKEKVKSGMDFISY